MTEKEAIEILHTAVGCCSNDTEYIAFETLISALPKHGHWEKVSDKQPKYCCTECNHLYNNKEYKRCPFCGAVMDGKKDLRNGVQIYTTTNYKNKN